jgi:hypothetical protein
MGFYTKNSGLIGTGFVNSPIGVHDIVSNQQAGGKLAPGTIVNGTTATYGIYNSVTFLGNGSIDFVTPGTIDIMVVGGGGSYGGGHGYGCGGGYVNITTAVPIATATTYNVVVGAGATSYTTGQFGLTSSFGSYTATGGASSSVNVHTSSYPTQHGGDADGGRIPHTSLQTTDGVINTYRDGTNQYYGGGGAAPSEYSNHGLMTPSLTGGGGQRSAGGVNTGGGAGGYSHSTYYGGSGIVVIRYLA